MLPFIAKSHTFTHACVCIWVNIDPIIVSLQFQQIWRRVQVHHGGRLLLHQDLTTATTYHTRATTLQHKTYMLPFIAKSHTFARIPKFPHLRGYRLYILFHSLCPNSKRVQTHTDCKEEILSEKLSTAHALEGSGM